MDTEISDFLECLSPAQLDEYFTALKKVDDMQQSDDENDNSESYVDPEKDWDDFIHWLCSKGLDIKEIPKSHISAYFDKFIFPENFDKNCKYGKKCYNKHCQFRHN